MLSINLELQVWWLPMALLFWDFIYVDEPDKTSLLLQIGDSEVSEFSSDSSRSDGSSWKADIIDWDYESDETDPEMIFHDPIDNDDVVSVMEEENINVVGDAECVIKDLPITKALNVILSDEVEPQEKISFGGIWWNSN